jgi:hypothetical protein
VPAKPGVRADAGLGGDACRRLEVDHCAAGTRATARENSFPTNFAELVTVTGGEAADVA